MCEQLPGGIKCHHLYIIYKVKLSLYHIQSYTILSTHIHLMESQISFYQSSSVHRPQENVRISLKYRDAIYVIKIRRMNLNITPNTSWSNPSAIPGSQISTRQKHQGGVSALCLVIGACGPGFSPCVYRGIVGGGGRSGFSLQGLC